MPTDIDLIFQQPAAGGAGSAVVAELVFGATPTGGSGAVTVDVSAVLPLPALACVVDYDPRTVKRFLTATVAHPQSTGRSLRLDRSAVAGLATPTRTPVAPLWATGKRMATGPEARHQVARPLRPAHNALWQTAQAVAAHTSARHEVAQGVQQARAAWWQLAQAVAATDTVVGEVADRLRREGAHTWHTGTQHRITMGLLHRPSLHRTGAHMLAAVWQVASRQRNGPRDAVVVPPIVLPTFDLLFGHKATHPALYAVPLAFGRPFDWVYSAPIYIPTARFYMAVHSIQAHLLPSLVQIPIFDVSLSADVGSFAWTFSATGPAVLFDATAPTAGATASVRITLDGLQWVFVVDSLQRQTQFGANVTRISGRSATALVGSPYARELSRLSTTARNAQQLAASALDLSGVGLDWGIDDWLVPAGAWSHTGTPLAAVQAIAGAAGGYVNSHRSAPTLLVRHPYPTLPGGVPGGPWNWAGVSVPDVELSADSLITTSIQRKDGPDVDGIYVSGTAQGVLAHVRRSGTSGAKLAAMVTDPLITASAAAQQRGLSVLGAAGPKHLVQVSLPVLTGGGNPGVLDVGQLVQINDGTPWRGRVRAVAVQAAQPKVRQTVTLERHLEAMP